VHHIVTGVHHGVNISDVASALFFLLLVFIMLLVLIWLMFIMLLVLVMLLVFIALDPTFGSFILLELISH
jgi:hypothetical protein